MTEFALEVLRAEHGDCLLLHHGGGLVLIDGGPRDVYRESLRPRLEQLIAERGEPLRLQLVMVSHIDDDHIVGLNDMFGEAADRKADRLGAQRWSTGDLWFNAFETVTGASAPRAPGTESAAVAAGVKSGIALRDFARDLGVVRNGAFRGELIQSDSAPLEVLPGLTFTILAPAARRIAKLQETWREWEQDPRNVEAAAILDRGVFNLSSIVVLAESGGKTMLLTGDARGDDVTDGLAERALPGTVDILKLPHHGSVRNVDAKFFTRVRARHYVISANGRDDNPDERTLELLCDSRAGDTAPWTVWFTYGGEPGDGREGLHARLAAFFAARPEVDVRYAKPGESLTITP